MAHVTARVLASDADVASIGSALLSRGNAVDAVVGGVFAASGLHPSVLLGPVQLLIGGAGAGFRAIDGRPRQPGLGNPRPRGFLPSEPIPGAARVGVPALPAALLAAVTTYGKLSVAASVGPGLELARGKSKLRAVVLERLAQRGPAALAEAVLADELTACAGRLAGGLLSVRDLDELRPVVTGASTRALADGRDLLARSPGGPPPCATRTAPHQVALAGSETRIVVAVDRNGLVAVGACSRWRARGSCWRRSTSSPPSQRHRSVAASSASSQASRAPPPPRSRWCGLQGCSTSPSASERPSTPSGRSASG